MELEKLESSLFPEYEPFLIRIVSATTNRIEKVYGLPLTYRGIDFILFCYKGKWGTTDRRTGTVYLNEMDCTAEDAMETLKMFLNAIPREDVLDCIASDEREYGVLNL